MVMIGAPRQFGFIPAAAPIVAPIVAPAASTAVGGAIYASTVVAAYAQVAVVAMAGALVAYKRFAQDAGVDPWGLFNSRPGRPAVRPPTVFRWPTGDWNPNGANTWRWTVTGTRWSTSGCQKLEAQTVTQEVHRGGGQQMWLVLADPDPHVCGGIAFNDGFLYSGPTMGDNTTGGLHTFLRIGGFWPDATIRAEVIPNDPATAVPYPQLGTGFPDGWAPPQVVPQPPPVLPLPKPAVSPGVSPETLPETAPSPVPVAPGVVAPPMVGTGSRPLAPPPAVGNATPTGVDGKPIVKPQPLVPTTPGDVHFPGGIPIHSNPPQATLQGIAQEVGRIENKMNKLLAPGTTDVPDWIGLAWRIWDFLSSANDQGEYSLHGLCERDADGNPIDSTRQFSWGGSLGAIGNVASRVDAIAEMLQYSKELKQPICAGSSHVAGEFVSVNFESRDKSPAGDKPLRKLLRYRDQTAAPLEAHVAHWDGFEWEAGGTMVEHRQGVWGKVQVWASTAVEGKRVIRHAAAIAGVDTEATGTRWVVSHSVSPRYGKPGLMRVRRLRNGAWMISKRVGPDGLPEYLAPVPTPPGP